MPQGTPPTKPTAVRLTPEARELLREFSRRFGNVGMGQTILHSLTVLKAAIEAGAIDPAALSASLLGSVYKRTTNGKRKLSRTRSLARQLPPRRRSEE